MAARARRRTAAVKAPASGVNPRRAKIAKASGVPPTLAFPHERAWTAWLASNHASSPGVWIKLARKGSVTPSITYAEALEVALAWGWIDGQRRGLDQGFYLQKFTRRAARSIWSKINREKALALISAGRMKPSGLAEVERARRDGRWEAAYDAQSKASVPADLAAALAAKPRAAAFFAGLDAKNRFAVLFRVHGAKKPETRARRIATFVEMLARQEKLYP
jgi:uncharacterized protein YdeI (YjbR/CyaY-like superfamily)